MNQFNTVRFLIFIICFISISQNCLKAQSNIDSLLQIRAEADHDTVRVNMNVLIGTALIKGDFESALFYYSQAIEMAEEISDQYPEVHAEALRQMALAYRGIRQRDKAVELLKEAMLIQKKGGLNKQLSYTQFDLGYTYQSMTQFETAILH